MCVLQMSCRKDVGSVPSVVPEPVAAPQYETLQHSQDMEGPVTRVFIHGKESALDPEQRERLAEIAVGMFNSCSMRSRQRIAETDWQKMLNSGDSMWVHFPISRVLENPAKMEITVTDILVPLNETGMGAGEIWVRDSATYYSPFMAYEASLGVELKAVIKPDAT